MITRIFVLSSPAPTLKQFNEASEIIGVNKDGLTTVSKATLDSFRAPSLYFYDFITESLKLPDPLATLAPKLATIFPDAFIYTLSDTKIWTHIPAPTPVA